MRPAITALLMTLLFTTAAPSAAARIAVDPESPSPSRSRTQNADDEREQAAQRASRQYQRGGAPRWGDSGHPVWRRVSPGARSVWLCIRRHESVTAGHYRAANPVSSASGAGQWLDSTWRGVAHWVKWQGKYVARKYSRAMYAPAWVQDAAYIHVYRNGGLRMWHGTWCPGT